VTANQASAAAVAKRLHPEMLGSPPSLTPPKEKHGQSGTMETIRSKSGAIGTGPMTGLPVLKLLHGAIPTVTSLAAWYEQSPPTAPQYPLTLAQIFHQFRIKIFCLQKCIKVIRKHLISHMFFFSKNE